MIEQAKENVTLPALQQQLAQTEKAIENMLNAIQQGIFTTSTKQRLDELEARKEELTVCILQEEIRKPRITAEQVRYWLCRFRQLDPTKDEHRQRLIDSFVNAVYVYDDKLILTFNYKDGQETISLKDINGSDLDGGAPPFLTSVKMTVNSKKPRFHAVFCCFWKTVLTLMNCVKRSYFPLVY